eukprot:1186217-Prorocentrum_minimum.AAC.1
MCYEGVTQGTTASSPDRVALLRRGVAKASRRRPSGCPGGVTRVSRQGPGGAYVPLHHRGAVLGDLVEEAFDVRDGHVLRVNQHRNLGVPPRPRRVLLSGTASVT